MNNRKSWTDINFVKKVLSVWQKSILSTFPCVFNRSQIVSVNVRFWPKADMSVNDPKRTLVGYEEFNCMQNISLTNYAAKT
jgi:hypothetical protein